MDSDIRLGGNIELVGFRELDGATMSVLKKMVGSYARKFSDRDDKFQGLKLTLKPIHQREKSEMYEIHAHLHETGQQYDAEATERNLFVAVDTALKKIEERLSKQ